MDLERRRTPRQTSIRPGASGRRSGGSDCRGVCRGGGWLQDGGEPSFLGQEALGFLRLSVLFEARDAASGVWAYAIGDGFKDQVFAHAAQIEQRVRKEQGPGKLRSNFFGGTARSVGEPKPGGTALAPHEGGALSAFPALVRSSRLNASPAVSDQRQQRL
jgi:hypothetical protein